MEKGGARFWRCSDFKDLPPSAVVTALSRLTREGVLQRVAKGVYYRSEPTAFGPSRAAASAAAVQTLRAPLHPSGLTGANFLGLSTQNPARAEYAAPAPARALRGAVVHTRRPSQRARLSAEDGAILETLRERARAPARPAQAQPEPAQPIRLRSSLLPAACSGVAGEVRLFEHAEFEQAMLGAAERYEVSEQFIEKDYYVTEILRIVARKLGDRVIFKGGTSLSKGWGLITRFSEDIDLFVNPQRFDPRPGKTKMDRILKDLAGAVDQHPALTWRTDEGRTIGGLGREDHFGYETGSGRCRASVRPCAWSQASRAASSRR